MSTVARLPPLDGEHCQTLCQSAPQSIQKKSASGTRSYYTLGNSSLPYQLPPPASLKPYQDTRSGELDAWPALTSGQNPSTMYLNNDKQLVVITEQSGGKSQARSKPKFLEQLERFLEKELRCLGVTNVAPSELRLQAYKEVFEYLIEDFKVYKPLLSAIKNEYEMLLSHQREQIRHLEPLQQMLVALADQSEQRIMDIRSEEKQEIKDLKAENRRLREKIDDLHNDHRSLEVQVSKLMEDLASQYLLYRDEYDARKLLIADINELHFQQEEQMISKQTMDALDGEKEDPLMLKMALKKAREDGTMTSKKLNEMIANYGDVIPRRDYEQLEKNCLSLEERIVLQKEDLRKLSQEHEILQEVHKQVLQQRDEYYVENDTLKRSATPRPKWGRCADFVAGGMDRWKELSDGKTSDQLVDVLLNEVQSKGGTGSGDSGFFQGLGYETHVPKYLQYDGKVYNRHISKRDCALVVHDIWREKTIHDAEREDGVREKMVDYMDIYLRKRFSIEQMIIEWAYNIRDAVQRYSNDDAIGLFFAVLMDEADEELYHSHLTTVSKLNNYLMRLDMERGDLGTLSREDFSSALTECFPIKDAESVGSLLRAAELELNVKDEEPLNYANVFIEDEMGVSGPFLEELKKQTTRERLQYVKDITDELDKKLLVSVEDLKEAILVTDPQIDIPDLERYLRWVFSVSDVDDLSEAKERDLSLVMTRLQYGNLQRSGSKF